MLANNIIFHTWNFNYHLMSPLLDVYRYLNYYHERVNNNLNVRILEKPATSTDGHHAVLSKGTRQLKMRKLRCLIMKGVGHKNDHFWNFGFGIFL